MLLLLFWKPALWVLPGDSHCCPMALPTSPCSHTPIALVQSHAASDKWWVLLVHIIFAQSSLLLYYAHDRDFEGVLQCHKSGGFSCLILHSAVICRNAYILLEQNWWLLSFICKALHLLSKGDCRLSGGLVWLSFDLDYWRPSQNC